MKRYLIAFAIILSLFSCVAINKQLIQNIDFGIRAIILPRVAIGTFLVESTQSICKLNMIKKPKPIFIRSLNAHFFRDENSFDITLDSIDITVINDQMTFSKIEIPKKIGYLKSDTIEVKVICRYVLRDSLADHTEKCLLGNYIIYRDSIAQKSSFAPCGF